MENVRAHGVHVERDRFRDDPLKKFSTQRIGCPTYRFFGARIPPELGAVGSELDPEAVPVRIDEGHLRGKEPPSGRNGPLDDRAVVGDADREGPLGARRCRS